ncbi:esterase, PHB depolymerase family [Anaerohalosphaera lusitana]|uniref:Esterase, PHB depolymerase family n=1 Tax=Anaerohalosphaera lusitana TaxID=1936003 RepID=A0A1U9NGW1_9BACT|nr:transglutaminase domain-containing protein [Anaerohalosphaera lusitana]AQT67045.1 esterase, PHB depolymerase family [Anaerohalosphaera lusitana]
MKHYVTTAAIILTILCTSVFAGDLTALSESAIERAGGNADELRKALAETPEAHKNAMRFLIAYMPERDLQNITADLLTDNVEFAYKAYNEAPWKDQVSEEMFLNNILPYACVNERRDNWREDFYNRFKPLIANAKTPGEAAVILNRKIFDMLDVHFSRKRPKADQSPIETIEAGMASCTGLSILLVDACRAVGVPARLAGTPLWSDKSGNHSWVEIWDGQWQYTGADEPSGDKLNRGWFTDRAATAQANHRLHAIYATSYKPTGTSFPLVWAREVDYVHAEDVTDRYTGSSDDTAVTTSQNDPDFDIEASLHAIDQLKTYLSKSRTERRPIKDELFSDVPLSSEHAEQAKELLWRDHAKYIKQTRAGEMKARQLSIGDLDMPFFYTVTGDKPADGRSLYISMHGGGGAPKAVNDAQYNNQKRLYKIPEGVYVAPRAPTDTWNLWHQAHIDKFFARLIENMIVFLDVNPNRVYLMGYSAGGDGVYQLAPRMADRFAAASMMAGHPNEASPLGLRNLPFSIQVGGKDAAYDRNKIAAQWDKKLDVLHSQDPDGYPHWRKIYPGKGHWMNGEDAVAVPWMAKQVRRTFPDRIVWKQDDVNRPRFYWLAVNHDSMQKGDEVRATLTGQKINIKTADVDQLTVRLNDCMLNLDKPVAITANGKTVYTGKPKRSIETIAKTLYEYGDPTATYSSEITVEIN